MRVVVAGSRWIWHRQAVYEAIESFPHAITEVVSGCNRAYTEEHGQIGVDGFGEDWAEMKGIPVKRFPYLTKFGKLGGPLRNMQMAAYADALEGEYGGLVLVWDGVSSGSASMKREGRKLILVERIIQYEEIYAQG